MKPLRRQVPAAARQLDVGAGEKVLAGAVTADGTGVAGTRDAFYLGDRRIPWETVERADWDGDSFTLRVSEVGSWGEVRPEHEVVLSEPGRLLELIRERVTASVVLQHHVAVHGKRGLMVIGRRAPRGDQPITWVYELDQGVDPDDPEVRRLAEEGLLRAQAEVGLQ